VSWTVTAPAPAGHQYGIARLPEVAGKRVELERVAVEQRVLLGFDFAPVGMALLGLDGLFGGLITRFAPWACRRFKRRWHRVGVSRSSGPQANPPATASAEAHDLPVATRAAAITYKRIHPARRMRSPGREVNAEIGGPINSVESESIDELYYRMNRGAVQRCPVPRLGRGPLHHRRHLPRRRRRTHHVRLPQHTREQPEPS
jgi:hypothetical protein